MKRPTFLIWFFASMVLAACVTTTPESEVATTSSTSADVPQRGLPAQTLDVGECGLFLWSLSGEPTFIFFSKAASDSAIVLLGEEPQALSLQTAGGDIFGQFTTQQAWRASTSGATIDVLLEPGEVLLDGQRVSGGRLNVTDANGWEIIIPVAGARACRSAPDPALLPPAP